MLRAIQKMDIFENVSVRSVFPFWKDLKNFVQLY